MYPDKPIIDSKGRYIEENIIRENRCKRLRWLDMSAGWGDRLFTACALEMDYLGFDPNENLKRGHSEMIKMFGSKGEERQRVVYKPFEVSEEIVAEDAKRNGYFDISLLSPPFYIIERYNGIGQSTDSYPEFNDWMVKFLFRSLFIIWNNLKNGGYLAINIANIRNCDMVAPMQMFIEDFLYGCNWEGIITFSGRGTQDVPGSVYVWRKVDHNMNTDVYTPEGAARNIWRQNIDRSLKACFPILYEAWIKLMDIRIE
jgi:hypothetical protein